MPNDEAKENPEEAAVEVAAQVAEQEDAKEAAADSKRKRGDEEGDEQASKKVKAEGEASAEGEPTQPATDDGPEPEPVPPSTEGVSTFRDNDVLSGRGGGTNVHPGNRTFRDSINMHRRAYLKARKNDKPAISRAIVRSIRQRNGRFLKKDEKTGLWFEIGDDAAREKTSQALRQRAPEMRKLLFDTEREEARVAAEDHIRHQRMMMTGMPPDFMAAMQNMPPMMGPGGAPMFNPAFIGMPPPNMKMPNGAPAPGAEAYAQMFNFMQQQQQQMGMPPFQPQQQQQAPPAAEGDAPAPAEDANKARDAEGGDTEAANKGSNVPV